ncbi:MAG: FxLYD domain-containing protein, partial [Limisphaerales bacterium]
CGEKTQLSASPSNAAQSQAGRKGSKVWIWLLVCVLVVVGTAAAVFVARRPQTTQTPPKVEVVKEAPAPNGEPEPDLWSGLKPGPVAIEKTPKSRLTYAVGTIRNDTDRQRFGVKVQLDVLDANGGKLGTTTDYTQFIDAHKDWTFKAQVAEAKGTSVKIVSITEK